MLLKTILNRIHPIKGFIYTKTQMIDKPFETITVSIEPRRNTKGICSVCGKRCPGYDRLPERQFQFVPLWNIPLLFLY